MSEQIDKILKKHNIVNPYLATDLNKHIYNLLHPKCNCHSCCEKRGEICLEDFYTEEDDEDE